MWGTDGYIYFVSDRDDRAQSNIWRVPQDGGEAVRITTRSSPLDPEREPDANQSTAEVSQEVDPEVAACKQGNHIV